MTTAYIFTSGVVKFVSKELISGSNVLFMKSFPDEKRLSYVRIMSNGAYCSVIKFILRGVLLYIEETNNSRTAQMIFFDLLETNAGKFLLKRNPILKRLLPASSRDAVDKRLGDVGKDSR